MNKKYYAIVKFFYENKSLITSIFLILSLVLFVLNYHYVSLTILLAIILYYLHLTRTLEKILYDYSYLIDNLKSFVERE